MTRERIRDKASSSGKIRVALVGSYPLLLEALAKVLGEVRELEVVGQPADLDDAVDLVRATGPDVLVMEMSRSPVDEIDTLGKVMALKRPTRMLVLSLDAGEHLALRMLRAGAHGILSKDITTEEVIGAVGKVGEGKVYLTPELQRLCAERYLRVDADKSPEERLTDREYQVARLLASGLSNREIAEKLVIGVKTVDTHRANLLRKLELRNNMELTRFALKQGLVD